MAWVIETDQGKYAITKQGRFLDTPRGNRLVNMRDVVAVSTDHGWNAVALDRWPRYNVGLLGGGDWRLVLYRRELPVWTARLISVTEIKKYPPAE